MKMSDFYSKELIEAVTPPPMYIMYQGCLYKKKSSDVVCVDEIVKVKEKKNG